MQDQPTAIISGGARITGGILEECHEPGRTEPVDLSVMAFGDSPWFKWWGPGLTTIGLPTSNLVRSPAEFMIRRLREGRTGAEAKSPARFIHEPRLIIRSSIRARATPGP